MERTLNVECNSVCNHFIFNHISIRDEHLTNMYLYQVIQIKRNTILFCYVNHTTVFIITKNADVKIMS